MIAMDDNPFLFGPYPLLFLIPAFLVRPKTAHYRAPVYVTSPFLSSHTHTHTIHRKQLCAFTAGVFPLWYLTFTNNNTREFFKPVSKFLTWNKYV